MSVIFQFVKLGAKLAYSVLTAPNAADRARSAAQAKVRIKAAADTRQRENSRVRESRLQLLRAYTHGEHSVFVDSNIWMAPEYHSSIKHLCQSFGVLKSPLLMHGEQYEEIQNIRKRTAVAHTEEQARGSAAAAAVRLMRDLAEQGYLQLQDAKQKRVHVDDYIVRDAERQLAAGGRFLLVTDDVELQTRIFTAISRAGAGHGEVLSGKRLQEIFGSAA